MCEVAQFGAGQRTRYDRPMPWSYIVFAVLTGALVAGLGYSTWRTALLLRTWRPPGNPLFFPADQILHIALCVACVGLGILSGAPYSQLGWFAPQPGRVVLLGVVAGLLLAAFFYAATRWVVARTGDRYYSSVVVEMMAPRSRREMALVAVAILPAVLLEELLFRSLCVGGLGVVAPAAALVLAGALIFGLMHSPQGDWGMTGAALAGLLFGVMFLWAGSLLLPIVAHYVVNVVQLWGAGRAASRR
jgi:uncharacterized protein